MRNITIWQIALIPWYALALVWAVGWLRVKSAKLSEPIPARFLEIILVGCALVLLFSKSFAFGRLAIRMFSPTPALDWTGVALTFVGSILAIWARLLLGQNWSAEVSLKAGHELVRSGPYAYIRHPIYAGLLLAVIGTATVLGEWRGLAAIALFAIAHGLKARNEEQFLSAEFGEEYRQYRERTGSLLPRLQVRMSR